MPEPETGLLLRDWVTLGVIAAVFTGGLGVAGGERRWPRLLAYFLGGFGGAWLGHQVADIRLWESGVMLIPAALGGLVAALLVQALLVRVGRKKQARPPAGRGQERR